MSKLLINVSSAFFLRVINFLYPFFLLPLFARNLGVDNFGLWSVALTVIQYFMVISDFGFGFSATKKVSLEKDNKIEIAKLLIDVVLIRIFIFVIILFFLAMSMLFLDNKDLLLCVTILTVKIFLNAFYFNWYFQGVEKLSSLVKFNIYSKIISIPIFYIFIKSSTDIYFACILTVLVDAVMVYHNIKEILKEFTLNTLASTKLNITRCYNNFKVGFVCFWGNFSITLYSLSTPLILSFISGHNNVGLFTIGDKFRTAFVGIFIVLCQSLYPRFCNLALNNKALFRIYFKRIIYASAFISILYSIILICFSEKIISIIFGSEYLAASILAKIAAFAIPFMCLSICIGQLLFLPYGYNSLYAKLPTIIGGIHIPMSIVLIKYYHLDGASIAIVFSELLSFILLLFFLFKRKMLTD